MIVYGRDKPKTYYIEIWKQPVLRWFIAKLYHWYDTWIEKVPFVHRFESWHHRRAKGDLSYIPLYCRRDVRCFHLARRGKVIVATLNIEYDQYIKIFPQSR